jgi:iron complex outermembrane receptor protein
MISELLKQPGFTPMTLVLGVVLYGAWTVAYVCIIVRSFRDRTYGVPLVALCFNIVWEFCWSFNVLHQELLPFFVWGNRFWFVFDVVLAWQLFRYGRDAQVIPKIREYFHSIVIGTTVLSAVGLCGYTWYFGDYTGTASSMSMNLSMSILFIFMLFQRPDLRGLSYPAAWLKMIGTGSASLFLVTWFPAQFPDGRLIKHPEVLRPPSFLFLYFVYTSIFLFDCTYIYLLHRRRKELTTQSRTAAPMREGAALLGLALLLCATSAANAAEAPDAAGSTASNTSTNVPPAPSGDDTARIEQLKKLSLEDLLVTTPARKPESVFDSPAAVSVITGDEIRRSGVRTLADALELAPGMSVSHINGNQWAISTRGFTDRFSNNLLVLIDGRAVYQPAFGGVYWDIQPILLEDIDHIEVVRGPGGTLWGANAVNGVVNVITKNAKDTTGGYVTGGYGDGLSFAGGRFGEAIGQNGYLRGYVQYENFDPLRLGSGYAHDGWDTYSAGFHSDWDVENNHLTFQGDYFYGHRSQDLLYPSFAPPYTNLVTEDNFIVNGGNLLGRFTHTFDDGTDMQLQVYWDDSSRRPPSFDYSLDVLDVDYQHRVLAPWRQEIVYGFGYRYLADHSKNLTDVFQFDPQERHMQLFSTFVQDEITLIENRLRFIMGTKIEHNDFTGFEYEPSARLAWTPDDRQTIWGAVSRAIRSPTRAHFDLIANSPTPYGIVRYTGSPVESEDLLAFELGYRVKPVERVSLDVSSYYFFFDNVDSPVIGAPYIESDPPPPHLLIPYTTGNDGRVQTYGLELGGEWQAQDWWRLRVGYSYFNFREQVNVNLDNAAEPHNQAFLRSSMDLGHQIEFDQWLRYRSRSELYDLPSYVDLDLRLGWRPRKFLEIALVGQNLLHAQRQDFGIPPRSVAAPLSEVARLVYGQVTFRF